MSRIRLPLAALVLVLAAACQSTAPTAPAAPAAPAAAAVSSPDSAFSAAQRGGSLIGSGN